MQLNVQIDYKLSSKLAVKLNIQFYYIKVDGKWRRIALAHYSYNNPFANGLVTLLGVLMLFIAVKF